MTFDKTTRKLTSDTGYIRALNGELYTDHPIYLGIHDDPSNYEEGNEHDYNDFINKENENA